MSTDATNKPQRTRVSAYGLVRDADRILLCRMSNRVPRWQGWWGLPGGGVEFGEHPEDAMVREVYEESGLQVSAGPVVAIDSLFDESRAHDFHGIRIIYRTRLLGGELRFETNGTTDKCGWFTREEAADLQLFPITERGIHLAFGSVHDASGPQRLREI